MCQSNAAYAISLGQTGATAVNNLGTTLYPPLCAATMSLPRYAFSDGKRLFVADGGNDRIMVYNSIPTQSGQPADAILGEPDEFSDNTDQNPDGTDALQTPASMAFDGLNLYVSDTYNRRVLVYSPGLLNIPLGGQGVVNAASLTIHAIGSVAIAGGIVAKDTVTVTINGTDYVYTIISTDTLETITTALAKVINAKPDPNVIASANTTTDTLVITARMPGGSGANITLAATTSNSADISATTASATLNYYLENPTSIAPGTLIEVNGQSLCDNTAASDLTQPNLPHSLNGCQLFVDGNSVPLLYASPTQINAQMPYEFTDRTSTSLYARATHADGSVSVTSPIAVTIVPENPGIFALYGTDPRPALAYHGSSNAIGLILVNGSVNAGDVGAITVGTNTYSYTVQATDTLQSIMNGLVSAINSAPDPNVTAAVANQFDTIILVAKAPGPAGEGIAIAQAVTNSKGSQLSLTVYNSATCCDNVQGAPITNDNPAVPGEVIYLFATGLRAHEIQTTSIQEPSLPAETSNPPATPVDSILTDQSSGNILSAALVQGMVGVYYVQFQLSSSLATDLATYGTTIAQTVRFVSNVVVFPAGNAAHFNGRHPEIEPKSTALEIARPAGGGWYTRLQSRSWVNYEHAAEAACTSHAIIEHSFRRLRRCRSRISGSRHIGSPAFRGSARCGNTRYRRRR